MEFSDENIQKLNECIEDEQKRQICIKLQIFTATDDKKVMLENIKKYISHNLRGEYFQQRAIDRFLRGMVTYSNENEFKRFYEDEYIEDGMIDYNLLLPIVEKNRQPTYKCRGKYLGLDGNEYIVKDAEGTISGGAARTKDARYARFIPTLAYALFKHLGEKSAEFIIACEKIPYYYILSKNFLKSNEEMQNLSEETFEYDNNGNVKQNEILKKIEEIIKGKNLDPEFTEKICAKLKLQYAVQETLKNLICSIDENLGNTSIVTTKNDEGEIEDINISPAYDMDLSFSVGEENLGDSYRLCRTTKDGKFDLKSIMEEFSEIKGYKEHIQGLAKKFDGNYIDEIFNIAYISSGIDMFKKDKIKEIFGSFLMKRAALFKQCCKDIMQKEENRRETK